MHYGDVKTSSNGRMLRYCWINYLMVWLSSSWPLGQTLAWDFLHCTCQRLFINFFVSHCPYDTHLYDYFCSCEAPLNSLMLPVYVCVFISAVTIYHLFMGVFQSDRKRCNIQRAERSFRVELLGKWSHYSQPCAWQAL